MIIDLVISFSWLHSTWLPTRRNIMKEGTDLLVMSLTLWWIQVVVLWDVWRTEMTLLHLRDVTTTASWCVHPQPKFTLSPEASCLVFSDFLRAEFVYEKPPKTSNRQFLNGVLTTGFTGELSGATSEDDNVTLQSIIIYIYIYIYIYVHTHYIYINVLQVDLFKIYNATDR